MSPVHIVGDGAVPFVEVPVGDGGVLSTVDDTIRTSLSESWSPLLSLTEQLL